MTDWATEKKPQSQRVLDLLWDCAWHPFHEIDGAITSGKGSRYGGRIGELRDRGWMILSRSIAGDEKDGNEYRLLTHTQGPPWVPRVKVYLREEDVAALLRDNVTSTAHNALQNSLSTFTRGTSAKKADKARKDRMEWFFQHPPTMLTREEIAYIRGCRDPIPASWGAPLPEDDNPLEVDILAMFQSL